MSVVLVSVGAGLFLFLGLAHAIFTLQTKPDGGPMMATNSDVQKAMQIQGGLGLAPEINSTLYQAWIGFNLSHSLGIVLIAGVVFWQTLSDLEASVSEPWFLMLIVVAPAAYLMLALRYWFDQPRNAIAVGAALVWTGTALELL